MLYVINNAIPFYTLYVIIIVYTALYKDIVFMRRYITKAFLSCCSSYTLLNVKCISLVYLYYIAKYIVFNYFISGYQMEQIISSCSSLV